VTRITARNGHDRTFGGILQGVNANGPRRDADVSQHLVHITVRASVHQLPSGMGDHVQWWIADPTGHPHVVPGSDATQWYWGSHFDISTANPGF
jgi:hypothetical protein